MTIPSTINSYSVTNLGVYAFVGCAFNSVTISNIVTSIGGGMFSDCPVLTNITIGNSVTNIGPNAFQGGYGLTDVTTPNSVTSIGGKVFAFCISLTNIYFTGNAPDSTLFYYGNDYTTVHYLPATTGWPATYGGRPTALWLPQMRMTGDIFGAKTNQFGFNINWASGQTVLVEACTYLSNPNWLPLQTNTLPTGSAYFSGTDWVNYPSRFYRLGSP